MSAVKEALFPAPVDNESLNALQNAVTRFDRDQLLWSSGYLAGLARSRGEALPVARPAATSHHSTRTWSVFYATETGNSARVAERLAANAQDAAMRFDVADLRDVRPRTLARIRRAIFVLATHGAGDPPEGTESFFDYWYSAKAPRLPELEFGVVALGDSSYADFCEVGRRFERRLTELGARKFLDRVDCDLDYDGPAAAWSADFLSLAARDQDPVAVVPIRENVATTLRDRPFDAKILSNQKITGRNASRDVRHIEIDLEGSGSSYQPGDSLGVWPTNPPRLVETLLRQTRLEGAEPVIVDGSEMSLAEALTTKKEVTLLSRPILESAATSHEALRSIIDSRANLGHYLETRQLTDLLAEFPIERDAQSLVDSLRRLTPRLYSIASSPDANPDEAHLTVGVVRYSKFGRDHWGTASNYLADGSASVPVYIETNDRFRLPSDGDTPIIMIGAGTGIAPYRAFLQHRQVHGQRGPNWLVFGDRNLASDFLYQIEWLRYRKDGLLTRLDVAFSRDQSEKIYVQHRLLENGADLHAWIRDGAHIYVCGDASRMAADVHGALTEILRGRGGLTETAASDYLAEMKSQRRYQRDVY